ncbi:MULTISPECIES: hypothetical protein [unclassified Streptomyces]|uniref:hypothetical protein n=1 Tax=Streptomyces sp. NPDC127532 TaxID=3345399 RepID=UPI0036356FBB
MNNSSKDGVGERPTRRRRVPIVAVFALVFLACVAAAIGVVSHVSDKVSSDLSKQEMTCCWEDGATPVWMSGQMGIRIPDAAADRRAGYKVGQRYDTGLLSFVLPSEQAGVYTGRLVREGTEMTGNSLPEKKDYRPAAAFAHLGLTEPETFVRGLRKTSLCPDELETPEGKYLQRCIDLFAHEFKPGATRIYVRSTIEPSVTPPPASAGP